MAIQTLSTTPRVVRDGQTGSAIASGFISIRLEGQEELIAALLRASIRAGIEARGPLNAACREALKPIMEAYKQSIPQVTGNLARSVKIQNIRGQRARGVGAAIGGPAHVIGGGGKKGKAWDVETQGAGNHAWLNEFGTGRRKAGTQGRRTPINVHQRINGRFRRIGDGTQWFRDDEFDRLGKGNYLVMSSWNDRPGFRGKGYPGEFLMALESGDTYGAMPAGGYMEKAIQGTQNAALRTLLDALRGQVEKIGRAA